MPCGKGSRLGVTPSFFESTRLYSAEQLTPEFGGVSTGCPSGLVSICYEATKKRRCYPTFYHLIVDLTATQTSAASRHHQEGRQYLQVLSHPARTPRCHRRTHPQEHVPRVEIPKVSDGLDGWRAVWSADGEPNRGSERKIVLLDCGPHRQPAVLPHHRTEPQPLVRGQQHRDYSDDAERVRHHRSGRESRGPPSIGNLHRDDGPNRRISLCAGPVRRRHVSHQHAEIRDILRKGSI